MGSHSGRRPAKPALNPHSGGLIFIADVRPRGSDGHAGIHGPWLSFGRLRRQSPKVDPAHAPSRGRRALHYCCCTCLQTELLIDSAAL